MMALENLYPSRVFYYFEQLAAIPGAPEIQKKSVIIWFNLQRSTGWNGIRMNPTM